MLVLIELFIKISNLSTEKIYSMMRTSTKCCFGFDSLNNCVQRNEINSVSYFFYEISNLKPIHEGLHANGIESITTINKKLFISLGHKLFLCLNGIEMLYLNKKYNVTHKILNNNFGQMGMQKMSLGMCFWDSPSFAFRVLFLGFCVLNCDYDW